MIDPLSSQRCPMRRIRVQLVRETTMIALAGMGVATVIFVLATQLQAFVGWM